MVQMVRFSGARRMLELIWRYRRILKATTLVEVRKKFAGSVLGVFWAALNPLLFLCIYLFLTTVVFHASMPGLSSIGVVTFIFSGLVPFLALMEAATMGTACIKQNMHMIKNVIVPIDLVPVRTAITSAIVIGVGLVLTLLLLVIDGTLSGYVWLLPVVVLLQLLFMIGIAWLLSTLGILLPDLGYFINTLMVALMFISPIGFRANAIPANMQAIIWLNPVHYMIDSYRSVLISGFGPDWRNLAIFALISVLSFVAGASFFRRFKAVLVDYE
jgi:lipopolysaccharide transport system permease protein